MQNIKLVCFALAIAFGVFMGIYGGYDDSPGGQLLGLVAMGIGIVGIVRTIRTRKIRPQKDT